MPTKTKTVKKETIKTTAKKTAKTSVKKTTAAKTTKKTKEASSRTIRTTFTYTLQFSGNDISYDQIRSNVISASGKDEKDIKGLEIYVKPEEGMAYYVINGTDTGSIPLF